MDRDPYKTLGVSRDASLTDIRSAYRALARKYHPDRNAGSPAAADAFFQVSQAYALLSDPAARKQYDLFGVLPGQGVLNWVPQQVRWKDVRQALKQLWTQVRAPATAQTQAVSLPKIVSVSLTLEEVAHGVTKMCDVPGEGACPQCRGQKTLRGRAGWRLCLLCEGRGAVRSSLEKPCAACAGEGKLLLDPCSLCAGQGRVTSRRVEVVIPPGVREGDRVPVQDGQDKIPLEVKITFQPHALFDRQGDTLLCNVPIPWLTGMVGGWVEVPTLEETELRLKIPPGTQSGTVLRVKGKGFASSVHAAQRGDAHYIIVLEPPRDLTPEQENAIRLLSASFAQGQHPRVHAFEEVVCRRRGSNPHARERTGDFESPASANSATSAREEES